MGVLFLWITTQTVPRRVYTIAMNNVTDRHFQAYKDEVLAHEQTKETSLQRMRQITFLMGEKLQLEKELEKERKLTNVFIHSTEANSFI